MLSSGRSSASFFHASSASAVRPSAARASPRSRHDSTWSGASSAARWSCATASSAPISTPERPASRSASRSSGLALSPSSAAAWLERNSPRAKCSLARSCQPRISLEASTGLASSCIASAPVKPCHIVRSLRIEELLENAPDRPALIASEQTVNYPELSALAEAKARELGDVAGQRILVLAPNVPEFVVGLVAVWMAGAVAVPLSARARDHEIATTLEHSGAIDAIGVPEHSGYSFVEALARHGFSAPAEPVDAAAILYTSGSSGQPKGAYLTHAGALHWGRTLAELLALTPEDRTALVIPLSHAFGFASLLACFASHSAAVLVDQARSTEPLVKALETATVLNGSPAVFAALPRPQGGR